MKKDNIKFLRTLAVLALPMVLQDFMTHSVNFVDMWMVGQLSLDAITGLGLSKRLFFLFIMLVFGINSGGAIFMGQYYGKSDKAGIHRVLGIVLVANLFVSALFASIAIFAPRWFLSIFTANQAVIEEGVRYLAVVSISYLLSAISVTLVAALRSIRQTKIPMFASACALVAKIGINYVFIFVLDMGVVGAAWATVISRAVEISVQIVLIKRYRLQLFTKLSKHFDFDWAYVKNYCKVTLPVAANEFTWSLGIIVYEIAYRFTGDYGQGAFQLSDSIQHIFIMMGFSIGAASGIVIANHLGAGDKELAIKFSRKAVALGTIVTATLGCLLFFVGPLIVTTYNVVPEVQHFAARNLMVIALFFVPRTMNYFFIIAILRQGGDTMFCLIVDAVGVWLIGIPMAFLGAWVFGLPIYAVLAMVYVEEVVKFFIAGNRVRKNKWANKLV